MLLFLLGVSTAAQADETTAEKKFGSLLDSKFNIALGGFFPRVDSTFSLNAPNGSSLVEVDAHVAYQASKHLGIGGGLKYFNLFLEANGGGGASYDYRFFGPAIFGYAAF
jgi:hypothetical protein